jgi:hypothetical protein
MNKILVQRIICDILIFILILNGWWFIALPIALFAAWSFSYYIEIILAGFIYDALFGFSDTAELLGYYGTILTFICLGVIAILKSVLRR